MASEEVELKDTESTSDNYSKAIEDLRKDTDDFYYPSKREAFLRWITSDWKPPGNDWREKVHLILSRPETSKPALLTGVFLFSVILVATVSFMLSSLPDQWHNPSSSIVGVEYFVVAVFTIEYVGRIITLTPPTKWYKWAVKPANVIDLLSIVPFLVELVISRHTNVISVIRVIRLLRIFRIFKIGKYSAKFQILAHIITSSTDGVMLLFFLIGLGLVLFSTALFYAEHIDGGQTYDDNDKLWKRSDGSPSPFQSIPGTFWWFIVTVTTVGYGDAYPVTWLGKIVGGVTMVCGLLVLANFTDLWNATKREANRRRLQKIIEQREAVLNQPVVNIIRDVADIHLEMGKHLHILQEQYLEVSKIISVLKDHPHLKSIIEQQQLQRQQNNT